MEFLGGLIAFFHSLFAFIIILVPLVVFHEFGHFVFARLFGVKAEIFSVGFGPKLWSRQRGETEWRISAIPLGGYVKLLGEERDVELTPEEQVRALHKQKPWKRFLIFFGGPLFNFILAVLIFMTILVIGEPHLASVVGRVVHDSAAEKAGFVSGDRILAVNEKPVTRFEEVLEALSDHPGKKVSFTVQHPRGGVSRSPEPSAENAIPVQIEVTPTFMPGYGMYGEKAQIGEVEGLFATPRSTVAGVSDPRSKAGQIGIRTGDSIQTFRGEPVKSWEEIEGIYQDIAKKESFELCVQKKSKEKSFIGDRSSSPCQSVTWKKPVDSAGLGEDFGLYSSELFVDKTIPKSPALKAGLSEGDRLIGVGEKKVESFFDLKDEIQRAGKETGKVELIWEHDGEMKEAVIIPTATSSSDVLLNKVTRYTVGVVPKLVLAEPVTVIERILNPIRLVSAATERMMTFSWRNLVSLVKMVTGEAPVGQLGGPIMIGKIAGESLARGLIVFLTNMAIFSVGLGVLNILPVPILDGGHLLLLGIEIIRGKPLTIRQMEILQSVGLIFILALMGLAFHNDFARLFSS